MNHRILVCLELFDGSHRRVHYKGLSAYGKECQVSRPDQKSGKKFSGSSDKLFYKRVGGEGDSSSPITSPSSGSSFDMIVCWSAT